MSDDIPEDVGQRFEALLDSFAVQTEHRDINRLDAMRELLVDLLADNGQRYEWTRDARAREWMREAIESIDRRQADS
jgi:hypothetical protein